MEKQYSTWRYIACWPKSITSTTKCGRVTQRLLSLLFLTSCKTRLRSSAAWMRPDPACPAGFLHKRNRSKNVPVLRGMWYTRNRTERRAL